MGEIAAHELTVLLGRMSSVQAWLERNSHACRAVRSTPRMNCGDSRVAECGRGMS